MREVNENFHEINCICSECETIKMITREELISAIKEFCEGQKWAADNWKQQPHIAKLFQIAGKNQQ